MDRDPPKTNQKREIRTDKSCKSVRSVCSTAPRGTELFHDQPGNSGSLALLGRCAASSRLPAPRRRSRRVPSPGLSRVLRLGARGVFILTSFHTIPVVSTQHGVDAPLSDQHFLPQPRGRAYPASQVSTYTPRSSPAGPDRHGAVGTAFVASASTLMPRHRVRLRDAPREQAAAEGQTHQRRWPEPPVATPCTDSRRRCSRFVRGLRWPHAQPAQPAAVGVAGAR